MKSDIIEGRAPETEPATACLPADGDIQEILIERIERERQGVGIVVGVIDAQGRRTIAHGALSPGDNRPLTGDTVFEIGSITKVFTALALADMAGRGEVTLDDPVARYLPSGVTMPERAGRQITLADLATHTSGLPRMPDNWSPVDRSNPYADYSVEALHQYLNSCTLEQDIGAGHLYSNLGCGLLGYVLARRAGVDFETLVRQRIVDPLGMMSTAIDLTPDLEARFAVGHDRHMRPAANMDIPALAGAGALRSTANDLLAFLAGALDYVETPLQGAMASQLAVRRATETQDTQALGWVISSNATGEVVWHNGGTMGSRGFVGFDRTRRRGVVVLTNMATTRGGDDIGFHLLRGAPLRPLPLERRAFNLDAGALERFAGRYEFSPTSAMTVVAKGGRLVFRLTGRGWMELVPESPTAFFMKTYDAQVTFELAPDGRVTGLIAHQNGRDRTAARSP